MKISEDIIQPYAVTPTQKSIQSSQTKEQNSSAELYMVKDRVTISNRAKAMSRSHAPAVLNDSANPILSYEIRKPYAAPTQRKRIAPFSVDI